MRASGIHGGEIRYAPDGVTRSLVQGRLPENAWVSLIRLLDDFPVTFAENKGVSFAVHYRASDAVAERLLLALERFIAEFAELELELIAGDRVFEIKLPGFDKGKAIDGFMDAAAFRRPISGLHCR